MQLEKSNEAITPVRLYLEAKYSQVTHEFWFFILTIVLLLIGSLISIGSLAGITKTFRKNGGGLIRRILRLVFSLVFLALGLFIISVGAIYLNRFIKDYNAYNAFREKAGQAKLSIKEFTVEYHAMQEIKLKAIDISGLATKAEIIKNALPFAIEKFTGEYTPIVNSVTDLFNKIPKPARN
ncbi:hypothetical protein [Mycoplasma struthionis]|uniref:Uncharacterized protein n=1 Tax=Mycoplasma struthionis TaxID=538220 RepID=A0A3G8LJG8_9MOLU|nr:hypothetical protein [Mycoplasma struthionis]AZG68788.1 hypothetical protein EGN60_02360 [Mycoplasma struthionis]